MVLRWSGRPHSWRVAMDQQDVNEISRGGSAEYPESTSCLVLVLHVHQ
jgi:hypothetical protein